MRETEELKIKNTISSLLYSAFTYTGDQTLVQNKILEITNTIFDMIMQIKKTDS